jgi:hypothetical protein
MYPGFLIRKICLYRLTGYNVAVFITFTVARARLRKVRIFAAAISR